MNVLFLSLETFESIYANDMYADLLRQFCMNGHQVYSISPVERRTHGTTHLVEEENSKLLRLKVGNIQKTNLVEKGISMMTIQNDYIRGIKKYFRGVRFDLVLYATPPITFYKVIKYIKYRDGASTYLMLKDIFPQNAVDLGMMQESGLKGMIYKYFRNKEKQLYAISDTIGCMSQANCEYVLKHNPEVSPSIVEICPNIAEPKDMSVVDKEPLRKKYGIPNDKVVFIYGGNLGKPQGITFLIQCLKAQKNNKRAFFLIVGDGTEYGKLASFVNTSKQENVKLMSRLPKDDYDCMVGSCDVGMIFLDHRFTIPNFPSRLLAYMQAKIPVLAVTDSNTDIGAVIREGRFGEWCESNDVEEFSRMVEILMDKNLHNMGQRGFEYMETHYAAPIAYRVIVDKLMKENEVAL